LSESSRTGRRAASVSPAAPVSEPAPATEPPVKPRGYEKRPFLLDFFPLETEKETRLIRFYDRLREGRLSTTRCPKDAILHWPPRTACPRCHTEELEWVDLPEAGRLYAFSAVLAGAPLGMESDVPFTVGFVDLEGVPLRLFGRIEGKPWTSLHIGERVRVDPYDIGDGRVFYRFRTEG
jgi:uncharacterized protein